MKMGALLLLSCLCAVGISRADEPLDFTLKFERQKEKRTFSQRDPHEAVFKVGEKIRAVYYLSIRPDEAIFTVDLDDLKQSDRFVVLLTSDLRVLLHSMLGLPVEAVLEITGRGTFQTGNSFTY